MNPVNATALFVSAARSALQCDPRDPRALAELCKLLPFFRQSLSCLVCGNLLCEPVAPVDSSCQHYVCLGCKGRRMQLRPSCSWCKDYSRFEHNRQLSLLVSCYRRLCAYVAQSPLAPHIAAAASHSPDLQAALCEGREMWQEQEEEEGEEPDVQDEAPPLHEAPPLQEVKEEPNFVNGHDCNGLSPGPGPREVCIATATGGGAGLSEIMDEGEGPLLLSVEEVLRTLDPPPLNGQALLQSEPAPVTLSQSQPSPAHCAQLFVQSENSPVLAPFRCHRKRSRSESDSQKVAPVSLSALRDPEATPPDLAPVPNGGPPRAGKALPAPRPLKKTTEHHSAPKKACTKARQQGAPRPRPQPRIPPLPLPLPLSHPPSPSLPPKPIYKKTHEKKGCKCGRATQNPSVLTCRGQRCPCYSNRKACLDCICRGCQNSYMANGEKKLEAFAVPEKALEQTRLTLGINLSSITALRNPATAAPANAIITAATGAPVTASFLSSGAGHEARVFDWSSGLTAEEEL
ncbi:E3 ubiquitin-protein ligase MSL2b [Boleophthalmus pectinirostris]|uniref:E3 ubiquitin-protein ligase MSL2b n=1 Tax=Boleophthalmus pectinirostris TaxID=150288 RepID=UPI002431AF86|nr:E3 ubiquitin-protein ligase MSL2b [Boleophthalmus pectinirostris]